ncbi:serine/threonine-protein kinase PknK [Haliangium sp.]|uniref:serine/threonine-protein kinase n=1 Tax=Haliangium sp. TaxID=2663208 RepID=UPI003D12D4D9
MSFVFHGTKRFQVLRQLGAGGMGVVYETLDRETNTRVALKTLRVLNGESLLRFKNEFRSLQGLQHENLVNLGELLEDGGHWFFTMELVEGTDFLTYVGRHRPDTLSSQASTLVQSRQAFDSISTEDSLERMWAPHSVYAVDEVRLRSALAQLVAGLRALHEAGKVHRDVKPSNCLVTKAGRVVVLDFGLISDSSLSQPWHLEKDLVGTVPYMSPEQARAKPALPAADLYSVGVVLYEALTGHLPFAGPPGLIIQLKQSELPTSPRSLLAEVPPDLDELCMSLLAINPRDRPTADEVLARLGHVEPRSRRHSSGSGQSVLTGDDGVFVGRRAELAALRQAYLDSRLRAVSVLVTGESGMGKSALVARASDQLLSIHPPPLVLSGRCHEREAVPYKAVDGIIDALSHFLCHHPPAETAALLPQPAAVLLEAFPVLERVEAIVEAPRPGEEIRDPQERRTRIFAAVRELFARLAEDQPLVLIIENIQWSDVDSAVLLQEILRGPDPPRLLLIATLRTPAAAAEPATRPSDSITTDPSISISVSSVDGELDGADTAPTYVTPLLPLPGDDVRHIALSRLSADEARALAEHLAPTDAGWPPRLLDAIARESGGHPLFIDELVRHAYAGGHDDMADFQLESALWARIADLDLSYQRLLRVVGAAGRPIAQAVAGAVAGLPSGDMALVVRALEVAKLVRTSGPRMGDAIEPYHDRVRTAVVAHLSGTDREALHISIAEALEDAKAPPEALAFHWGEAGRRDRAARYAITAAVHAARALAFDRAARFYRRAIDLADFPPDKLRRLYVGLGKALVNAGRGGEAANAYLDAAAMSTGDEALELRRRAVEHRLRAGYLDEALEVLHDLLEHYGLRLPTSQGVAKLDLVTQRSLLALRGTRFHPRSETEVPRAELMKIDVCWSVAAGIVLADPLVGAGFIARNLRLSLAAGEPYRLSRALSLHAMAISALDARNAPHAAKLREIALDLAHQSKNPHAIALATMADGWSLYWRGNWKRAFDNLDHADAMFRSECTTLEGSPTSRLFALWCLFYLGELTELSRRLPALLAQAQDRGDLQAAVNLGTGIAHLVALADDDPARARRVVREHFERWPGKHFYLQHWSALAAETEIDLYRGDWAGALERLERSWSEFTGSVVFRNQKLRQDGFLLAIRCHLAAAAAEPDQRGAHLRQIERHLRRIEREDTPWSAPLATMTRATVAWLQDDPGGADALLGRAADSFAEIDMALHADVARCRRAQLAAQGQTSGEVQAALRRLRERGVRRPASMLACLAPGFGPR